MDAPSNFNHRLLSAAASVNATLVYGDNCRLRTIVGQNAKATGVYLKLYDKATAPTQADTPEMTFYLPPSTGFTFDLDHAFENGLGYRLTTDNADAGTTALAAGDVLGLNIAYRA